MVNRKQAPTTGLLEAKPFPPVEKKQLSNGTDVYLLAVGTEPVVEIQIVFPGGSSYEPQVGVASLAGKLFTEGTERFSSAALAQKLDFYGAFFDVDTGYEITSFALSTLSRRLPETIDLLQEIIFHATFPPHEFDLLKERLVQKLKVDEQKTDYWARKKFLANIFGSRHPYGSTMGLEELKSIGCTTLWSYYLEHLRKSPYTIFVAGKYDAKQVMELLEKYFATSKPQPSPYTSKAKDCPLEPKLGLETISLPDHPQATLRVGHPLIPRNHPDYYKLRLVVMILGGYFGSRLMKNIREDKGYTYGIYSSMLALKYTGILSIGADVGKEFVPATLQEIHKEIRRMQVETISETELQVAKNYLLGKLITELETPGEVVDTYKNLWVHEIPVADYEHSFEIIQSTTAAEVQRLSQLYFHPDRLTEVVCGENS